MNASPSGVKAGEQLAAKTLQAERGGRTIPCSPGQRSWNTSGFLLYGSHFVLSDVQAAVATPSDEGAGIALAEPFLSIWVGDGGLLHQM